MKGVLVEICPNEQYDIVDTRNDQYHRLKMYYGRSKKEIPINSTVEFEITTSAIGNTYAKFISLVERNDTIFNTEDRSQWYDWGANEEIDFVTNIVPLIGDDIRINPDKNRYSWAIDLYDYTRNRPADLKTQNTPFFTVSRYRYKGEKCDPAYSVTFNRKDYENYKNNYPNCDIYFWVHWTQRIYRGIEVPDVHGVWKGSFHKMAEYIENGIVPLHPYQNRQDDDHNAKDSYVFNLQDEEVFQRII